MKPALFMIIALLSFSCLKSNKNDYYIKVTSQVEIVHAEIPDTVVNNSAALIKANAQAPDGCWSNLRFLLSKSNDFEYTLEAYGIYESYGTCPEITVYGDTTISFLPTKIGLYKFYVFKSPNDIEIDTMIVN
jgi:hypothetical protein